MNLNTNVKNKAIIVASVASMIQQFNMHNIQLLLDNGYEVDVVCNYKDGNTISTEKIEELKEVLNSKGVKTIHMPIPRNLKNVHDIVYSVRQLSTLIKQNNYKLLHCHSPIGGVISRLSAMKYRKRDLKVIYTAHGFHFYKGAPIMNWVFFFPIEYFFSWFTDVLITINNEDYNFAQKYMHSKKVVYIPGIGIDTEKFSIKNFNRRKKREILGIQNDEYILLSVGELNENKNHETVIKAISLLNNEKIHYFIAGKGDKCSYLNELANNLGVKLHLLGYRTDINELLNCSDVYLFPSLREGLSVALMEAMASGLPCVVSKIRGNVDLIDNNFGGYLCKPTEIKDFSRALEKIINDEQIRKEFGQYNLKKAKKFDKNIVLSYIREIYFE